MCAEYGENFSRPHFHACLFGLDFKDKSPIKETEGLILYNSPLLDKIWGKGYTSVGDVTFESAAYVARYITKKITGEQAHDHYQTTCPHTGNLITLEPEFTTMSLKPGIGKDWYKKYKSDCYPSDNAIINHRRVALPRYYDKLYELEGEDIEEIKRKRKKNAAKTAKDRTPERLETREKSQHLKFKRLIRSYENNEI